MLTLLFIDLSACLTFGADAVVVRPPADEPVPSGGRDGVEVLARLCRIQVFDLFALDADQVRVCVGDASVVAVRCAAKLNLQDLARFLKDLDSVVYRRQAGLGEVPPDLFVNLADAGVGLAGDEDL